MDLSELLPTRVNVVNPCMFCEHSGEATAIDGIAVVECAAFPDGVPLEISIRGRDHVTPLGGEVADSDGNPILWSGTPEDRAKYETVAATYRGE